jgi:hypothetical protein
MVRQPDGNAPVVCPISEYVKSASEARPPTTGSSESPTHGDHLVTACRHRATCADPGRRPYRAA